jgi:hypothetical protein
MGCLPDQLCDRRTPIAADSLQRQSRQRSDQQRHTGSKKLLEQLGDLLGGFEV